MKLSDLQELVADASPGEEEDAQRWLEAGSPRGGVAWTSLQFACALGDQELVKELLEREKAAATGTASATSKTAFGYSALHIAARFGHIEVAKLLLSAGLSVHANAIDAEIGCSPLHLAVLNGDVEMARVLLGDGKASQVTTKLGTTPLEVLDSLQQQTTQHPELRRLLVDREAAQRAFDKLSGWLAAVGMVEYAPQFVAQGFDDPEFLLENSDKALTDDALDAMGVAKPGHRSKLRALFGLREYLESFREQSEEESEEESEGSGSDEDESSENESGSDSEEDEA